MAPTSSKFLELSTDEHKTTFMNVTQMLSSLTCTPKLKWVDNPSPLNEPQEPLREYHCSHGTTICFPCNTLASCSPKPYSTNPQKTPLPTDAHPPTGRTDVAPYQSGHVSNVTVATFALFNRYITFALFERDSNWQIHKN